MSRFPGQETGATFLGNRMENKVLREFSRCAQAVYENRAGRRKITLT